MREKHLVSVYVITCFELYLTFRTPHTLLTRKVFIKSIQPLKYVEMEEFQTA